jgi:hypothetical protein
MKKILLVSASALSLAAASSAFADSNKVYLDQTGVDETATVTQSNNGNTVGTALDPFAQGNGVHAGSSGNSLTITQTGNDNSVSKDSPGFQQGAGNTANISQAGYQSDVELQQTGTGNGTPAAGWGWTNDPSVYNGISQDYSASGSKITLTQNGSYNVFDLGQGGADNKTFVTQDGDSVGFAFVRQAVAVLTPPIDDSGLIFPMYGSDNTASVSQTGGPANYAVAVQGAGNGNNLTINQNGDYLGANIWQIGNGNYAASYQTGNHNVIGVSSTILVVPATDTPFVQTGSHNGLAAFQGGSDNLLNGYQYGSDNQILSGQYGTGSSAVIHQDNSSSWGSDNTVVNVQGSNSQLVATQTNSDGYIYNNQDGYALATITQNGYHDSSTGNQFGGPSSGLQNTATVSQGGSYDVAFYSQSGSSNTVGVTQTGGHDVSSTLQTGSGNSATVTQH